MTRTNKKKIAISLRRVSKTYKIKKPNINQIDERYSNNYFQALSDINLDIYRGEKIGIIGDNGSGKTTLLKIISGITSNDPGGQVKVEGHLTSLIDLTAGFHPDLSGKENIFLNGIIIGMSKKEIINKYDEIINFSGLRDFIDNPLYTYSTGMCLRLGFSVAISSDPDILLLDEGINVGDIDFQKKIHHRLELLFKAQKTVVTITHWTQYLRDVCSRIIWMNKGKIVNDGGLELINLYRRQKHD